MEKEEKCKLCNKEGKFVKSHIIPKSFYEIDNDNGLLIINKNYKAPKRSPIGIYDSFLCNDCEEYFNDWDNYGIKIFQAKKELKIIDNNIKIEVIKEVDNKTPNTKKAKLFFLSVLWRAHHCNQDLFKSVDLGSEYENLIKNILLNKSELKLNDYSVLFTKYEEDSKGYEKLCFNPEKLKLDGINFYHFHLGQVGYQFYIKVDQRVLPDSFEEINLGYSAESIFIMFNNKRKLKYLSIMPKLLINKE